MDETSSIAPSLAASPESSSLPSEPSSPLHYLSGLAVSMSSIAGVVVLSLAHQLNDVPGWMKLVALAWSGMAATDRARLATTAIRGYFKRK